MSAEPTPPFDVFEQADFFEAANAADLSKRADFSKKEGLLLRFVADPDVPHYVLEGSSPPKSAAVLVHGLCEHAFRFFPLALLLVQRGIRVYLAHLAGHGAPPGEEGSFHWLARESLRLDAEQLCHRFANLSAEERAGAEGACRVHYRRLRGLRVETQLQQVERLVDLAKQASVGPVLLGGHSLGGLIAAEVGARVGARETTVPGEEALVGVMLFNPALQPTAEPDAGFFRRLIIDWNWRSHSSRVLAPVGGVFRAVGRLGFPIDCAWASRWFADVPLEQALHAADPLIQTRVPSSYLVDVESQMDRTGCRAGTYPVPVFLQVSADDKIVDARGAIRFGSALRQAAVGAQCEVNVWADFYAHDPLRSTRTSAVEASLQSWLSDRLPGLRAAPRAEKP